MRYLAIDLGDKRTGLAVGDDVTGIVSPAGIIEQPVAPPATALRSALMDAVREHQPQALVIGLPLNMNGTEGSRARLVREFGDGLATATGLAVHYQDERLSSAAADREMAGSGRTHKQKKRLRDALAAATILRDFLSTGPDGNRRG